MMSNEPQQNQTPPNIVVKIKNSQYVNVIEGDNS